MLLKFIFIGLLLPIFLIVSACSPAKFSPKPSSQSAQAPLPKDSVSNTSAASYNPSDSFFLSLFKQYPSLFNDLLANKKNNKVQIIYTQINRDAANKPHFITYTFNENKAAYFYPASTVKLPIALLALQKLNETALPGISKNSTMITGKETPWQTAVYNQPNSADGRPTIAHYLKQMLLVSSNEAFNRLYEYLGQEYINTELNKKGYKQAQILHRLSVNLSEKENRQTNPIFFYNDETQLIYSAPGKKNVHQYAKRNDFLGKAYYKDGRLIQEPMNFSNKNKFPLAEMHLLLKGLIFPQEVPAAHNFNITENDRNFLLKYMSAFPSESVYPSYDSSYYDAYVKFLLYGAENRPLPKSIRIFNKVGAAYGQLTDVAYIVDFERNIEFFLSATIYCNSDEILNDDVYDYEKIGFPFLKNLGRAIYQYEWKRKKLYPAILDNFKITYDK